MNSSTKSKILLDAAELVECGWLQGTLAASLNGCPVPAADPRACRWCIIGAIEAAATAGGVERHPVLTLVWDRLSGVGSSSTAAADLAEWNDMPGRTAAEVAALLRSVAGKLPAA